MGKDEKIKQIIFLQKRVNSLIHEKHHDLAQKHGLSLEQYHLLVELEELMLDVEEVAEAPTIGDIAQNVNNSQNTVSEKVSRLEKKGLVLRVRDEKDRRISRVVLTQEGKQLVEEIGKQGGSKFLYDSLSCMDVQMVDHLLMSLRLLIDTMEQKKEKE